MKLNFLPNTEMGNLIRTKDWSKTSLGEINTWPEGLLTALSIMMNSRFPMFLFWGKELVSFYNDAYRPSFGNNGMHPAILGKPAEEAWADIWHIVKKFPEQVLTTGIATWEENQLIPIYRNGKTEDVYWTFSHSPVHNAAGIIEGIFVLCMETTQEVIATKKIKESEERFRTMAENSSALIAMDDETSQAVYFNKAWMDLTGRSMEDLTETGWLNLVHLKDKDRFLSAYLSAIEKREKFASELRILNKQGKYSWLLINATPRYFTDGLFAGYISSGTDITDQKRLQQKEKKSNKELTNLFAQAPVAMCILRGHNYVVEMANNKKLEIWGRQAEEVLNKPFFEAINEAKDQGFEELLSKVYVHGESVVMHEMATTFLRNGKLETIYLNFTYEPLLESNGTISGIISTSIDVTDQLIARKRIEESENRYRQLIQAAPIAIGLFVGKELVIQNPNKEFIDIVGKGSDIEGRRLTDVMPELIDHGQPYLKILDDVFTSGITYQSYGDPVSIVRSGVMHHGFYDIYYVPIFDTAGNVYAILDIAIDVTETVLNRKKIEENEQRFRLSLAGTNQTFFSQDKNLRYTWIHNPHDDFKAADVVGKTDEELLETSSATILTTLKREILATGKAFNGDVEYKIVGQSTNYTMHLEPIKGADGSVIGIIGTGMDITERVKSEQKIKESEQKFRLLADSMPQFVWTSNEKGELNYFSSTVYHYSGLSKEELERDGWLHIVHPEEREENIRQWMHSIETGETFHFEHRFRRFDGEYKWQLSRAIPQRNSEGRIQMWVGTSTEIQQQKEIREQLEESVLKRTQELLAANDTLEEKNRELEKMNKELESLTYISSHDLQEPLRKIQMMSSRILQKEIQNLTETGKDYFQRLQNAASRMQRLIEDLLAFSRTNTAERKFELTDLEIIVHEVENELKELISENHAVIETHVLCEVNIIPFQFRQLLHNLISNAIKFSKPGSTPHVLIDSRIISFSDSEKSKAGLPPQMFLAEKEYCHITVKDSGIGFDPQYSERIFEVFQRLHGKSEFAGTGIGLAIVKKIVENHKGFIVAKGELGKGATFNIYIPVT